MKFTGLFFITFMGFMQTLLAQPNVIIFFTDDQETLDTRAYGSKDLYTSNMDRLAKEGVRFTQTYAHAVCCPSRTMLLTGRFPQRSGIVSWTHSNRNGKEFVNLPKSEITIAEILKGAGYATGLFGKWHLGAKIGHSPLDQGFDEFYGHLGGFIDNYNHYSLKGGFHDLYDQEEEIFEKEKYFPDLMTRKAIDFITRNKEKPFFLYVAFNLPHYPEQADAKFDERYKDLPMPRQSYAKVVSTTDDRMGWIMKHLDKLGLSENTVIIFMSDNGHSIEDTEGIKTDNDPSGLPKGHYFSAYGGGGNTGKWRGNKGQFYEGGIRVPAIITYPKGIKGGQVRDQAITACDWMPTILELCNVAPPQNKLDGQSVMPIINDNSETHNKVMHWSWMKNWAVRKGSWKLINVSGTESLVNLDDEKPEVENYIEKHPELAAELKKLHNEWYKEVNQK
jgi:arylsulfatase A-like enzyme